MRLIDADDLIRQLEEGVWNSAVEEVKNQPTAYDVEAVVRELEEPFNDYREKSETMLNHRAKRLYYRGLMRGFEYAIEIVKRGGRNEKKG